jgi:hypothetical protein
MLDVITTDMKDGGVGAVYKGMGEELVVSSGKGAMRFLLKESVESYWQWVVLKMLGA